MDLGSTRDTLIMMIYIMAFIMVAVSAFDSSEIRMLDDQLQHQYETNNPFMTVFNPSKRSDRQTRSLDGLDSPLIRFGKRNADGAPLIRFGRAPEASPFIRFGKRSATGTPLIRFGRSSAPFIRFG